MDLSPSHIPVLADEILDILTPLSGEKVLDCTVGLGGHAAAFIEAGCELTGLDADTQNLDLASSRLPEGHFYHANFRDVASLGLGTFDIIFADLGLSSPHIDDPSRGFTFREDGPLDLRFDQSQGTSASSWIASRSTDDIAAVLIEYAEVRQGFNIAVAIKKAAPTSTFALRDAVEKVLGFRAKKVLPQIFQAMRIVVNDELNALNTLLNDGITLLSPGGRFGIISYHSLEDRMVKQFFRGLKTTSKDPVTGAPLFDPDFILLTKRAVKSSEGEIASNPRARSARFRAIERKPTN